MKNHLKDYKKIKNLDWKLQSRVRKLNFMQSETLVNKLILMYIKLQLNIESSELIHSQTLICNHKMLCFANIYASLPKRTPYCISSWYTSKSYNGLNNFSCYCGHISPLFTSFANIKSYLAQ